MTGLMNCLTTERNSCVNVWFWNLVAPPWSLSTSVDSCSSPGSSSKASQIYIISSLTSDDSIFLQITGNYLFCLKVINGLEYSFSLKIIHWQRPIKIWVNNNFLFNGFILEHIHNLALYLGYYNYKRNKSENDPFPVDSPCFTLYVKQTVSLFQKNLHYCVDFRMIDSQFLEKEATTRASFVDKFKREDHTYFDTLPRLIEFQG